MKDSSGKSLAGRLDAIYEFDREPVSERRLQGPGNFVGLYAGEHVAGTEFVIGPLFVAHGVAAGDLLLGLLVGNLLAVLSWAFICAPIATRTRLNLYWKLRKIAGPNLLFVYNIVKRAHVLLPGRLHDFGGRHSSRYSFRHGDARPE